VADKIQSLNPTLIKNVNLIQPGWKLQMPADSPTVAPAASKKSSSGNGKRIALGILSMLGVGAALVFSKKGKKASSAS
jgi:LysM repeat protein